MSEMLAKAFSLPQNISSDAAGDILYEEIQKIKNPRPNVDVKIEDERLGTEWPLPQYETDGSAGIDLRACITSILGYTELMPGEVDLVSTGISVAIEPGWAGQIIPRSGKGHKEGLVVGNLVGLIDSDYRGTVYVSAWNRSENPVTICAGDRIAQMVLVPTPQAVLEFVDTLDDTDRTGGFGSTGDK